MSQKEQSRSEVMRLYVEGYIKQKEAGRRMGLSTRQVRRLASAYRLHGSRALIHGHRGKASNRKIREDVKQQALALVGDLNRSAGEIAGLYQQRWQIKLFFKWIKQNLEDQNLLWHVRKCCGENSGYHRHDRS